MGYFSWEERYGYGYGHNDDYKETAAELWSMNDHYFLLSVSEHEDPSIGLLANVKRTTDKKCFTIPLEDLAGADEKDVYGKIVNDYSYWFVNN